LIECGKRGFLRERQLTVVVVVRTAAAAAIVVVVIVYKGQRVSERLLKHTDPAPTTQEPGQSTIRDAKGYAVQSSWGCKDAILCA
jgi:hypothetical protein